MKVTWLLYCFVMAAALVSAQRSPAAEAPAQAQVQPQEVKVTEYSLPPDKLAKAEALYTTRTVLYLFGMVFGIAVLLVLLKLRVAPAFRDLAERLSRNSFVQALVFVPLLTLLISVISLPVDIYGHHISLAYGLSVQGWGSWAGDWCKAQGVAIVIGVFTVFALFRIIRKSPRRWWFYFWLATLPFVVLLMFVAARDPRADVQHVRVAGDTQPLLVSAIEKVTAPRRPRNSARPHVRDEGQRESQNLQRLRHRHRRLQAGGRLGQHMREISTSPKLCSSSATRWATTF